MNAIASPNRAAFEASYGAGRGTLVWTTGVADLQTPVAAFLKLASGRPNSFLLESIENGSARSPLLHHRHGPGSGVALPGRRGGSEPARPLRAARLRAGRAAGAGQPARADRGNADEPAGTPTTHARRIGGLPGLRHGAAHGAAAGQEHGRAWAAGRGADPPDRVRRVRQRARRADPGRAHLPATPASPPPKRGTRPMPRWRKRMRRCCAPCPRRRRPCRCRRSRSRSPT